MLNKIVQNTTKSMMNYITKMCVICDSGRGGNVLKLV